MDPIYGERSPLTPGAMTMSIRVMAETFLYFPMAQMVLRVAKKMTPISDSSRSGQPVHNHKHAVPLPASSYFSGFTLLEIMLVMAIIAMASLVIFPALTGLES